MNNSFPRLIDGMCATLRSEVLPDVAGRIERQLRAAMRAEVDIELRNSPRPLFAEMSSGREE